MNTKKQYLGGAGTTTDGIAFGTSAAADKAKNEAWNGTSWTEVADLATGRYAFQGAAGSGAAAWAAGGTPVITATEEFTVSTFTTKTFDTD